MRIAGNICLRCVGKMDFIVQNATIKRSMLITENLQNAIIVDIKYLLLQEQYFMEHDSHYSFGFI